MSSMQSNVSVNRILRLGRLFLKISMFKFFVIFKHAKIVSSQYLIKCKNLDIELKHIICSQFLFKNIEIQKNTKKYFISLL